MQEEERRRRFEDLLTTFRDRIFNLVYWRVNDYEEAKDLTQEIFLKAYKALPKFREESSPYTWLYRIALNHTSTFLRKHKILRFFSLEHFHEEQLPEDSIYPCEEDTFLKRAVREKVLHLPQPYRDAIVLFYFDGKTCQEIAEILGTSLGTIKSRLSRGRAILSEQLKTLREKG